MRILFLVLLMPFFCAAQNTAQQINNAEAEVNSLNKKKDSLLLKIENLKFKKIHEDIEKNGLPKLNAGEEVVYHLAYALVYAESYEQAKWVAHVILPDVVNGNEGRTNDFRPDDKIKQDLQWKQIISYAFINPIVHLSMMRLVTTGGIWHLLQISGIQRGHFLKVIFIPICRRRLHS